MQKLAQKMENQPHIIIAVESKKSEWSHLIFPITIKYKLT